MEAADSRRTRASGGGGQLRSRTAHAPEQSLLEHVRVPLERDRVEPGRYVLPTRRLFPAAAPDASAHVHPRTSAARQPYSYAAVVRR